MNNFLASLCQHKLILPEYILNEIESGERRHICIVRDDIEPGEVIQVQSEFNHHNSKNNERMAHYEFLLISTKESFTADGRKLSVYGLVSVADLPRPFYNITNAIFSENIELRQKVNKFIAMGMNTMSEQSSKVVPHAS